MQRKKEFLNKHINPMLFQDTYGVLQIVANTTLTGKPRTLKLIRWLRNILKEIRQLWFNNSIIFFEIVWADPVDFMQETICQKRFEDEGEMYNTS